MIKLKSIVMDVLREYSVPNTNGITAYHRSTKKFYTFNISNVSTDSNKQKSGWGLYFSDSVPHNQYGDYLYKVKLFNNKNDYVLIDTNNPVEGHVVNKTAAAIKERGKNPDEVVEFAYNGYLFYKTMSRILGGDKHASLFLFDNGVDGLKRKQGKNSNDYVLFGDDYITIEDIKYDPY